ncbi:hypothetical protein Tco_0371772 [Tanacetum coccineum]
MVDSMRSHLWGAHELLHNSSIAAGTRRGGGIHLRRKRSVYRRARTEFNTSAFAQFHAPLSADYLLKRAIRLNLLWYYEGFNPSVAAE